MESNTKTPSAQETTPAPAQAELKYSPLPWKAYKPEGSNGYWHVDDERGDHVATCYDKDVAGGNAVLIARAANRYADHVKAAACFAVLLAYLPAPEDAEDPLHAAALVEGRMALAALAKAEGRA